MPSYLPNYIRSRVDKNQNYMLLFVGQTGTGKSYAAMSLAEDLDPNFNIERIVFSSDEFISVLNNDESLAKGSVIVWDEAGVGMPAREWYSISNKVISYVVQTFRVRGYILIMTTPSMSYIDSQIRALFHGFAQTIDPSISGGIFGWAKYLELIHDPKEGKTRMKYPTTYDKHNRKKKIIGSSPGEGNILFPKPSEGLIEDYEVKKKDFTDSLIASASDMMAGKVEGTSSGVSILKLKELIVDDPARWGMGVYSAGKFQTHIYMILKTEYPEWDIKMTDIKATIHAIEHDINTGKLKLKDMDVGEGVVVSVNGKRGRKPSFEENDVPRVMEAIEEYGFTKAAKKLEVAKSTLNNFRERMRETGKWPDVQGTGT